MDNINVKDLPEPVAKAIEIMVETLRGQWVNRNGKGKPLDLPKWPGIAAISPEQLRRVEIYRDVG